MTASEEIVFRGRTMRPTHPLRSHLEKNAMCAFVRVTFISALFVGGAFNAAFAREATFTPTGDNAIGSLPFYEHNNEGGLYWQMSGQWGMDQRPMLRFDVSSLGGMPDLQVNSIVLKLFSVGVDSAAWTTATLHPKVHAITAANRDWVEGPGNVNQGGDGTLSVPGTSCWSAKVIGADLTPISPWAGSPGLTTAGVDYDATVLATRSLMRTDLQTVGTEVDFVFEGSSTQLTGLINTWLTDNYTLSRDNPGLLLFNPVADPYDPELHQRFMFYSRQEWTSENSWPAPQPGWRPQLVVNYSTSSTAPIIENASFEDPFLTDIAGATDGVTGWSDNRGNGKWIGCWNPGGDDFTGAKDNGTPLGGEGTNVVGILANGLGTTAELWVDLTDETLQTGIYTLTAALGQDWNESYAAADYRMSLITASGVVLASYEGLGVDLTIGSLTDHSVTVTIPHDDLHLGESLQIRFTGVGTETDANSWVVMDNVRLEFVAIPEPATLGLLTIGGFTLWRKRR